jgi:hypothetical protein
VESLPTRIPTVPTTTVTCYLLNVLNVVRNTTVAAATNVNTFFSYLKMSASNSEFPMLNVMPIAKFSKVACVQG